MNNTAFRLPAEWEPQSAVQLTWPHYNTDWKDNLDAITDVYIKLVKEITDVQLVVIACHDTSVMENVKRLLVKNNIDLNKVRCFIAPCNDTWARDHGPITLVNSVASAISAKPEQKIQPVHETKLIDFQFNAWGAKYDSNLDNEITRHLYNSDFANFTTTNTSSLILEGGSIESDGDGVILTTTRCLLNKNRNSSLSQDQIEASLKEQLNASKVLWLEYGYLAGDDTDAHIDTLARFSPDGIVYVECSNKHDPHYDELAKMASQLKSFSNNHGQAYNLYPLPMANPITNDDGELLPATYANFLVINQKVLVPTYNIDGENLENDQQALNIIKKAYPNREVVGINCCEVIKQFGSLHCLTMQLPFNSIK
jgi:agmatine/peptidylarginine deiminase